MIVEHRLSDAAHDVSSIAEIFAAEVREWKNELEFSRSMEMAWQFVKSGLERKSEKN